MMTEIDDQTIAEWNADLQSAGEGDDVRPCGPRTSPRAMCMTEALQSQATADDPTNYEVAQEGLDRLAVALAVRALFPPLPLRPALTFALQGDVVAPVIFEHVPKMIQMTNTWKWRFVALMSMSMIFEGATDALL